MTLPTVPIAILYWRRSRHRQAALRLVVDRHLVRLHAPRTSEVLAMTRSVPRGKGTTGAGRAWADFSRVQMQDGTRPMGPHMMLFDPGGAIEAGNH